jgi:hypothetical protein
MEIKQNNLKQMIIAIVILVTAMVAPRIINDKIFHKQPTFDKVLVEAASEISKNAPIMVDSETRFDSVIALTGKRMQYFFTLVNYANEDVDMQAIKEEMTPAILNGMKTNSQSKLYRDQKVTLLLHYSDKTGKEAFIIEVTPKDYE